MKSLLCILADKDMKEALLGLFSRTSWHRSMGCGPVAIDDKDLLVPPGQKDPGVFKRAHELARAYLRTHERLVVLLDCAWNGSPGRTVIEQTVADNLERNGWDRERFEVIAIEPELETWLWSDVQALQQAFEREIDAASRATLTETLGELMRNSEEDPKIRLSILRDRLRIPASSAQFRRFASRAHVDQCTDPAFARFRAALGRWFPP
ncbi:MAG: hypothetical protein N2038_00625 [Geminicoccaceae bacterium]|nr:hypothetical protein [Geminicoccaceae bacterium]MCS7267040.1 hypothetical protein [Geminicoccaceae bacterium]MCX7628733.1 hypothetical protein [Geminicoccaceae bacterium]MDW8123339.1 hypothetical protein [Geminicoccaceae bacterium]MDW8341549.1 hypothetical protein [Geminicoccaceae bacterium]